MSNASITNQFILRRTPLGGNLLDVVEGNRSQSNSDDSAVGTKVAFFPCGSDSFDGRALEELMVSAVSIRRRVVIVWLDPTLKPQKSKEEFEALEDYLGQAAEARTLLPTSRHLVLVSRSANSSTNSELSGRDVAELIRQLERKFDLVLIAAPSALSSHLGTSVAQICDQSYLFVRQSTTSIADVERTTNRIRVSGGSVSGIIYTGRKRLIPERIYRLFFGGKGKA